MDMFKLSDIKAGYLLRVKDEKEDKEFNMTVVPAVAYNPHPLAVICFDAKPAPAGHLACCGAGDFWPINHFTDDLECRNYPAKVIAVYGYTHPKGLLDNSTEDRELLWERKEAEEPVEESPAATVKMTKAEICEKLGFEVEIVD